MKPAVCGGRASQRGIRLSAPIFPSVDRWRPRWRRCTIGEGVARKPTPVAARKDDIIVKIPLRQYLALFAVYLKPQWPRVTLLSVLLLASIGLQLLNPQVIRYFIDTALAGGA